MAPSTFAILLRLLERFDIFLNHSLNDPSSGRFEILLRLVVVNLLEIKLERIGAFNSFKVPVSDLLKVMARLGLQLFGDSLTFIVCATGFGDAVGYAFYRLVRGELAEVHARVIGRVHVPP